MILKLIGRNNEKKIKKIFKKFLEDFKIEKEKSRGKKYQG